VAPPFAANKKNPVPADEQSIARGKQLYDTQCATCHGAKGKGDGPAGAQLSPKPTDLSTPQIAEQSDGALFWKITEGRPPMPAYRQLSEEQRWDVVNYLCTLGPQRADTQPAGRPNGPTTAPGAEGKGP
jgi:mono/diheme cytochrome c family protein